MTKSTDMSRANFFKLLILVFKLIEKDQRKVFFFTQIALLITAFFELGSIVIIADLMNLIFDTNKPNNIDQSSSYIFNIFSLYGINDVNSYLIFVILFYGLAGFFCVMSVFIGARFTQRLGMSLGDRILESYLNLEIFEKKNFDRSVVINLAINETRRFTDSVLTPFFRINVKIFTVIALTVYMSVISPAITFFTFLALTSIYLSTFSILKKRLYINSGIISKVNESRIEIVRSSLNFLKIILIGRELNRTLINFKDKGIQGANAYSLNQIVGQAPRYIIENLLFMALGIFCIIYTFELAGFNEENTILSLTVIGLSLLKLLPSLQQIFQGLSTLRGNIVSIEKIYDNLITKQYVKKNINKLISVNSIKARYQSDFYLKDIKYYYNGSKQININIKSLKANFGDVIFIKGESGSGKSTLADFICGIRSSQYGYYKFHGFNVNQISKDQFWKDVFYLPQQPMVIAGSIINNVIFGSGDTSENFSLKKVKEALKAVKLEKFIDLNGQISKISIRQDGDNLSGGQKQRLILARVYYSKPKLIVLDEATSGLDKNMEKNVLSNLIKLCKYNSIIFIIAHNEKIIEMCNRALIVKEGLVKELNYKNNLGSYSDK